MKLFLTTTLLLVFSILSARSQELSGKWIGIVKDPDSKETTFIFRIEKNKDVYKTTIVSPTLESPEINPQTTTFEKGIISIDGSNVGIEFEGKLNEITHQIEGSYFENGSQFLLVLKKETLKTTESKTAKHATSWFSERSMGISMLVSFGTLLVIMLSKKM